MQSSPASCHFLLFRYKYSPQHPLLKHYLHSSLSVRDHISHQYKTTGNIMVLYILIFKFLESRWKDRMVSSISWISSALNLFVHVILICYCCSQIFELWQIFKRFFTYQ
jgi:hypothetical protein